MDVYLYDFRYKGEHCKAPLQEIHLGSGRGAGEGNRKPPTFLLYAFVQFTVNLLCIIILKD